MTAMKIAGFTFIRNAIIYDYPIVEAIRSILPICDIFVIAVGKSSDSTLDLILDMKESKIQIMETVWNDDLREGGRVLAEETKKAFNGIPDHYDWAFYIQADEVVHEKFLSTIHQAMFQYRDHQDIDGLLFNYLHFYGSYDFTGVSSQWYKHEIRVIKNDKSIYSFRDAQGFRRAKNRKLRVLSLPVYMYHYGWVRDPGCMQKKQENFHKFWHNNARVDQNVIKGTEYDYLGSKIALSLFTGDHPAIMQERIKKKNWHFDYNFSMQHTSVKDRIKGHLKKFFGISWITRIIRL